MPTRVASGRRRQRRPAKAASRLITGQSSLRPPCPGRATATANVGNPRREIRLSLLMRSVEAMASVEKKVVPFGDTPRSSAAREGTGRLSLNVTRTTSGRPRALPSSVRPPAARSLTILRSSVHLARDPLGLGVDAFGGAVAVRTRERGVHSVAISVHATGEGVQMGQVDCAHFVDDKVASPARAWARARSASELRSLTVKRRLLRGLRRGLQPRPAPHTGVPGAPTPRTGRPAQRGGKGGQPRRDQVIGGVDPPGVLDAVDTLTDRM